MEEEDIEDYYTSENGNRMYYSRNNPIGAFDRQSYMFKPHRRGAYGMHNARRISGMKLQLLSEAIKRGLKAETDQKNRMFFYFSY